jgi:hypothetical protein
MKAHRSLKVWMINKVKEYCAMGEGDRKYVCYDRQNIF